MSLARMCRTPLPPIFRSTVVTLLVLNFVIAVGVEGFEPL